MNYEVVDIILRLGAAAAAGVIIGINRDLTNKPIGMRTLGHAAGSSRAILWLGSGFGWDWAFK